MCQPSGSRTMWISMAVCFTTLGRDWLRSAGPVPMPLSRWPCSSHSSGWGHEPPIIHSYEEWRWNWFPLSVLSSNVTKCFQPDSSAGPRTVLFDLRVVHDPYVQRRADRDGTLLHVGGRLVRQSHGERRRDSKLLSIVFHTLQQMKVELGGGADARCEWTSVTVSHCPGLWMLWWSYPVKLTLTSNTRSPWFVSSVRMPSDSLCFGRQQISTKTCIAWPWPVLASTAISCVCTSCPNISTLTRRSLKRSELFPFFACFLYIFVKLSCCFLCFSSRCFQNRGGCPPVRLLSSNSI